MSNNLFAVGNVLELANELAVKVFQSVTFVHDQVLEVVLGQKLAIGHDDFVRGDDDGEIGFDRRRRRQEFDSLLRAFLPRAVVQKHGNRRRPTLKTRSPNCSASITDR